MFDKGVYFSDASSKSANYTFSKKKQIAYMILSEVSLGEQLKLKTANYSSKKILNEKNSVQGVGRFFPDPKGSIEMEDVFIPCGNLIENNEKDLVLFYNEFIVYNTKQIFERFLVEIFFS